MTLIEIVCSVMGCASVADRGAAEDAPVSWGRRDQEISLFSLNKGFSIQHFQW